MSLLDIFKKKEKEVVTADGQVVLVKQETFKEKRERLATEKSNRKKRITLGKIGHYSWVVLRYVILIGIAFMILYPFVVRICVSFMSTNDIVDTTVMYIPREGSTFFIQKAMQNMNYWTALLNTFLLSALIGLLQLFVATFCGYGFARFKFWGSNILFFAVILTLIIPSQTIIIPLYSRFSNFFGLNLLNTFWPLLIMSATGLGLKNGLYIYMMRQFFRGMPKELEASAFIDGAGHLRTFFVIMLPNAMNMMITVFLFAFTWQWTDTTYNDLLIPKLDILANTVMKAWNTSSTEVLQQQSLLDTGALLMIFPLLIVFLVCQRYFVQSIERSGLVE